MWVGGWSRGSLDDTPPLDNVIPLLVQVHLLVRGTGPLSFRSGRFSCGDTLSSVFGRLLCKSRLRFLPLHTAMVVRGVISPTATALRLFPWGRASTRKVGAPTSDAPQLCCVWPKCWQRLHCSGPFGATYDSTNTCKPRS